MARFGKQDTVGLDTTLPGGSGRVFMTRYTLTEDGTLNHVALYSTGTGGGLVKGLVYADNAGSPGALVAVGAPVAVVHNGWATSAMAGQTLPAGNYWLGAITQDFTAALYADDIGGTGWAQWGDAGYASPPNPWSGGGSASYLLGVYADYDPGGGPAEGDIAGAATVSFAAAAAPDRPPPGPISGTTSMGFTASAAPYRPVPETPTFAGATSNGTLSNGDRTLTHVGTPADSVANCLSTEPITGQQYLEMRIERTGGAPEALGAQLYGGTAPLPSDLHLGVWYGQPGLSANTPSEWWLTLYANSGLPHATNEDIDSLGGDPQTLVIQMCVVEATRAVWVRRAGQSAWLGGGDPAAGTLPSTIMDGTAPIYPGANVGTGTGAVTLLTVDEHVGTAPTGFTNYMEGEAPPPGEVAGTTSVSFAATAALAARGTLAGAASVSFAATAAAGTTAPAAGTTSVSFAATAAPAASAPAAGTTSLAFTPSATGTATAALAGTVPVSFAATGALAARAALAGTTSAAFTATARATGSAPLAGAAGVVFTVEASPASDSSLAGTTGVAFIPTGAARAHGTLAGAAGVAFVASARPATGSSLAGTASVTFTPAGALAARGTLAGSAPVVFSAAGRARGAVPVAGTTGVAFAASAAPSTRASLAGTTSVAFSAEAGAHAGGTLAGTTGVAFSAAAGTSGTVAIAGTAALALTPTASGRALLHTGGAVSVSFTAAGAARGVNAIAGAASVTLTPAAALTGVATLRGAVALAFECWLFLADDFECPPETVILPRYPERLSATLHTEAHSVTLTGSLESVPLYDERIVVVKGCG